MWSAGLHDQPAIHHRRSESVIPGVFENPQSISSQKHIVFRPELVGSPAWTRYAKITPCGKPFKCAGWVSTKILRCCRDLFRPWAKNSSNSKASCFATIPRVFRAIFLRSSSWHRFMVMSQL